jgi:putative two-component system response regulator
LPDTEGRILIVDDEEVIRTLVSTHLESRGFQCEAAANGRHALQLAATACFDVVLTDVGMPGLDGLSLVRELQTADPSVPVVVVTAHSSFDVAVRALRHGAYDFVLKPFPLEALDAAVGRAMERRRLLRENRHYQRILERKVEEKTAHVLRATSDVASRTRRLRQAAKQLRRGFEGALAAFGQAVETRCGQPAGHAARVRSYALLVGQRMGLTQRELSHVGRAAWLHDLGLLSVPEAVLAKPTDELDPAERAALGAHPRTGHALLSGVRGLEEAAAVVLAHREHFDGSGQPAGLAGSATPAGARCLAVAVALENRVVPPRGRPALTVEAAVAEVSALAGSRYAPDAVDALLAVPLSTLAAVGSRPPAREPVNGDPRPVRVA